LQIWNFSEDHTGEFAVPEGFPGSAVNGRAVALGYFDGVHNGHREILSRLCRLAADRNLTAMVHTFANMPKSKTNGSHVNDNAHLTTLTEKCGIFDRIGINEAALYPFSESISSMKAVDFLDLHIKNLLHAKVVVAGEDYRFGFEREGDMHLLASWGKENGIEVFPVPPVFQNERIISSTWIRDCVRNGRMSLAGSLLGGPISYEGIVQEGKRLGRTLGFPTANLMIEDDKVIPAYGVYASVLITGNSLYPSITSVGLRPTVNTSDFSPLIETMVYDHTMDLYGQKIRVFLISFIRPEYRFPDVHSLQEQVQKDMAEVRHFHDAHAYAYSNLLSGVI